MTYEEFKKTIFYTANNLIIPIFGYTRINKINFIKNGKYDFALEDDFLRNLYKKKQTSINENKNEFI